MYTTNKVFKFKDLPENVQAMLIPKFQPGRSHVELDIHNVYKDIKFMNGSTLLYKQPAGDSYEIIEIGDDMLSDWFYRAANLIQETIIVTKD